MDQNQIYELFKKIDEKVDKISVSQARTEVFLDTIKEDHGEIRSDLKYHIQRTNLLEHEVTKLRGFFFYFSVIVGFLGAAVTIFSSVWKALR